jgi:hypothetical protein
MILRNRTVGPLVLQLNQASESRDGAIAGCSAGFACSCRIVFTNYVATLGYHKRIHAPRIFTLTERFSQVSLEAEKSTFGALEYFLRL